jgi:putative hemolysin
VTPVVDPVPRERLEAEVETLADALLLDTGRYRVYCAPTHRLAATIEELGRLRELTFRAANEGTGNATDIDRFDAHYLQLFAWDAAAGCVIGAYRLGFTDRILERFGKHGLYSQTLFDFDDVLMAKLTPGIELGRSFVRVEYQRDWAPLMLLWRGIARLVEREPRYAVLFGAVSISAAYEGSSRALIVEYLIAHRFDVELARHLHPLNPYRLPMSERAPRGDPPVATIEDLSRMVADIEHDRKGIPVLLRQYLRCGGRLLGFSTDERFAGVLDGLVMLDLRDAEPQILARYMGAEASRRFFAYHGARDLRTAWPPRDKRPAPESAAPESR